MWQLAAIIVNLNFRVELVGRCFSMPLNGRWINLILNSMPSVLWVIMSITSLSRNSPKICPKLCTFLIGTQLCVLTECSIARDIFGRNGILLMGFQPAIEIGLWIPCVTFMAILKQPKCDLHFSMSLVTTVVMKNWLMMDWPNGIQLFCSWEKLWRIALENIEGFATATNPKARPRKNVTGVVGY